MGKLPPPHGQFHAARILEKNYYTSGVVYKFSLRESRIEGDLEPDPQLNEIVKAYVTDTNPKKGCFVRIARLTNGHVRFRELADGYLHEPRRCFPPGRLVMGKVKTICKEGGCAVELDMRQSTLLETQEKLTLEDIKAGSKHDGIVTRVESYGVMVRLNRSDFIGLAHISQCSDGYISKPLQTLYDPGDLVRVYVLKVEDRDDGKKRIQLSMKPSLFEGDEEEESSMEGDSSEGVENVVSDEENQDLDSDDENYASKLADKMDVDEKSSEGDDTDEDSSEDESSSDDDDDGDSSSSDSRHENQAPQAMDTNVGFDWDGTGPTITTPKTQTDSSSDSDSTNSSDSKRKSSHKSRKKIAAKRTAEAEILRRETALADGTADLHPERPADFERLIASDPNFSEYWIKYMAYYLTLADVDNAREVASRAFERIEFRQENEKLNVWTALLTLELKYGTEESWNETVERACRQNNPKRVYLRVAEMLEREFEQEAGAKKEEAFERAQHHYTTMCKKFKSKKSVWIAHFQFLLRNGQHDEAHELLKRSMKSLPSHKHVETVSKFAQLEYEFGSAERARTLFDALLEKYPKRTDLLFVYVDKEVKVVGDMDFVRGIFRKVASSKDGTKFKYSDKQMKSFFKKWYRIEEEKGGVEHREEVKEAAKAYVERSIDSTRA